MVHLVRPVLMAMMVLMDVKATLVLLEYEDLLVIL